MRRSPCGRDILFFPIALWWLYWRLYVFLNDDLTIRNWIGHRSPSTWSRVLRHHYKLSSLRDSSVSELLSIASFEKVLILQKHPELFITSTRKYKMDNNCPLNHLSKRLGWRQIFKEVILVKDSFCFTEGIQGMSRRDFCIH